MDALETAMTLRREGRLTEALPLFVAALQGQPSKPDIWFQAARTALDMAQYPLAARFFQACVDREPTHLHAANGLWYSLFQLGQYEQAAAACRRAWDLDRCDPQVAMMLGQLAYMLGDPEAGQAMHERALELDESGVNPATAFVRLVQGDYDEGWRRFLPGGAAQRSRAGMPSWTPPPGRVWDGRTATDATVCVYRGGGSGDLFLFARYVPMLAGRVGPVVIMAQPEHDRVLESLQGLSGIVRGPDEAAGALFAYIWSLPGIFGTRPETIPGREPYLRAPSSGPSLSSAGGPRVGLAWAGHPATSVNPDRSVPSPHLLQPLFETPGIHWVSMQVGHRADEANHLPFADRPVLADFGDTAFALSQLDLLITVDTAIANLAGALGTPTWVIPPTYPEFRWGVRGDRTPWYPAVRLFRRAHTRDWEGVIARLCAALIADLKGAGPRPPVA